MSTYGRVNYWVLSGTQCLVQSVVENETRTDNETVVSDECGHSVTLQKLMSHRTHGDDKQTNGQHAFPLTKCRFDKTKHHFSVALLKGHIFVDLLQSQLLNT